MPSTTTLLSVAEAARRLGVGRARVYQLIEAGALHTVGTQPVRITMDSVEQRLNTSPTVGAPLASLGAWAVLALGSGDAAFLRHVAGLLSDPDRSRARSRLRQQHLLEGEDGEAPLVAEVDGHQRATQVRRGPGRQCWQRHGHRHGGSVCRRGERRHGTHAKHGRR